MVKKATTAAKAAPAAEPASDKPVDAAEQAASAGWGDSATTAADKPATDPAPAEEVPADPVPEVAPAADPVDPAPAADDQVKEPEYEEGEDEDELEVAPVAQVSNQRLSELATEMRNLQNEIAAMSEEDREILMELVENPEEVTEVPLQASVALCNLVAGGLSVKEARKKLARSDVSATAE